MFELARTAGRCDWLRVRTAGRPPVASCRHPSTNWPPSPTGRPVCGAAYGRPCTTPFVQTNLRHRTDGPQQPARRPQSNDRAQVGRYIPSNSSGRRVRHYGRRDLYTMGKVGHVRSPSSAERTAPQAGRQPAATTGSNRAQTADCGLYTRPPDVPPVVLPQHHRQMVYGLFERTAVDRLRFAGAFPLRAIHMHQNECPFTESHNLRNDSPVNPCH